MKISEDTSTSTPEEEIGGPVEGREYPFTDWRLPPDSGPKVQYTARYYRRIKVEDGNVWWDMVTLKDTPEEVREFMTKHHKDCPYVVYKVTTVEEVVDTSGMHYEPHWPYGNVKLES